MIHVFLWTMLLLFAVCTRVAWVDNTLRGMQHTSLFSSSPSSLPPSSLPSSSPCSSPSSLPSSLPFLSLTLSRSSSCRQCHRNQNHRHRHCFCHHYCCIIISKLIVFTITILAFPKAESSIQSCKSKSFQLLFLSATSTRNHILQELGCR